MQVSAILFDLDETLYSREEAFRGWLRTAAGERELDWAKVAELDARGYGPKAPLLEHLAEFVGWSALSLEERLTRFRLGLAQHIVAPHLPELLERLRRRYRLGLVTNGSSEAQRSKIQMLGIGEYLDPILVSEEVGVRKPDARIFELAADAWQLPKHEILCVGDSEVADVQGARDAGLRALWVKPGASQSAHAIAAVTEIEEWLRINDHA